MNLLLVPLLHHLDNEGNVYAEGFSHKEGSSQRILKEELSMKLGLDIANLRGTIRVLWGPTYNQKQWVACSDGE